ncbi:MAG TPA: porin [Variovorax sp.]|nr:porin [Variovorax sp.]
MKRSLFALLGAVSLAGGAAAQSSVTVYGLIDLGVTAYKGGQSQNRVDSGISNGSRLGFRGTEDLGDGLNAIYDLEMPIQADIGNVPAPFFGRESWVGLRSPRWGTLTLGRQTEFMAEFGFLYTGATMNVGAYGFHPGDYDRISGILRVDNSIKYMAILGPVKLGALVSLGEVAGSSSTGQAKSFVASYQDGPLSAALIRTSTNNQVLDPRNQLGINTLNAAALTGPLTTNRVDVHGAGMGYRIGNLWLKGMHTRVTLELPAGSPTLSTTDVNVRYDFTPLTYVGVGVARSSLENSGWNKAYVIYDYRLSTRTEVYASYMHLKTNAGNRATALALPPSTTPTASALRVALLHRF